MQWFTVWIGLFQIWPSVRTTNATTIKHAPIPGPLVKQITSISSPKSFKENEPEVVVLNASRKASSVKSKSTFLWWLAVSRGRKPLPVGAQYVRRLLLKIVPSLLTIPTPILFADPSKPMANVLFFCLGGFGAAVVADIFLRFLFYDDEEKQEMRKKNRRRHFFLSKKKFLPLSDHFTRARKNERSDVTVVDIVVTTIAIVSGTDNVNVKKNTRKEEEEDVQEEQKRTKNIIITTRRLSSRNHAVR